MERAAIASRGHAGVHDRLSAQQEQLGECNGLSVRGEFRMNAPRHFEFSVRRMSWNGCDAEAATLERGHHECLSIVIRQVSTI